MKVELAASCTAVVWPPPCSLDACLTTAVQEPANLTFMLSLVDSLGARSICLSEPRKAAHVRSLASRGMLAVPLNRALSLVCTAWALPVAWRGVDPSLLIPGQHLSNAPIGG